MNSSDSQLAGSLRGKVAVVTGASRGAGRGIALALGEVGATVYVTGRSVRGQAMAADRNVLEKSGKVLAVGDLAEEYGFTDVDGRRIPAFRIPDHV